MQDFDRTEVVNTDDTGDMCVPQQHYFVFSYVSTTSTQTCNTSALKARGCFPTEQSANEHAALLQSKDPDFDVWVMQMYKWCPFPPDILSSEAPIHYGATQDSKLSDLMQHINDEKSGKTQEFMDRLDSCKSSNV